MSKNFGKKMSFIWIFIQRVLYKNVFLRSIVALSIPITFIILCGSYIGWDTSANVVKFDLKLIVLVTTGSILCAFDGFWYVNSFSRREIRHSSVKVDILDIDDS